MRLLYDGALTCDNLPKVQYHLEFKIYTLTKPNLIWCRAIVLKMKCYNSVRNKTKYSDRNQV